MRHPFWCLIKRICSKLSVNLAFIYIATFSGGQMPSRASIFYYFKVPERVEGTEIPMKPSRASHSDGSFSRQLHKSSYSRIFLGIKYSRANFCVLSLTSALNMPMLANHLRKYFIPLVSIKGNVYYRHEVRILVETQIKIFFR